MNPGACQFAHPVFLKLWRQYVVDTSPERMVEERHQLSTGRDVTNPGSLVPSWAF